MKKLFLIAITLIFSNALLAQAGADSLLNFILKNKSRTSIVVQKNDYLVTKLNEDRLTPLESTVKIIVAIEFAKQASYNVFSFNAYVPLAEVNKYYLPNTDGDAQPNWLRYETRLGHIRNDSVRLIDIARGMMMYNSNANSEYLMDMLGFSNMQTDLHMLGLKQHTLVYPLVSSLFLYQNPKKLPEEKLLKEIQGMKSDNYYQAIFDIHKELKFDTNYKQSFRPQDLTIPMQKAWGAKLTASTAKEYARVCRIINSRLIMDARTYQILAKILETGMETTSIKAAFDHIGMKGGATLSDFTRAAYATTKEGTKVELVYFFNNLTSAENYKLQSWMNDFEMQVFKDDDFRKRLADGIAGRKSTPVPVKKLPINANNTPVKKSVDSVVVKKPVTNIPVKNTPAKTPVKKK